MGNIVNLVSRDGVTVKDKIKEIVEEVLIEKGLIEDD